MQEINIRKVFVEKNPKLARLLPGFLFRYLERILHQTEMNDFLRAHGEKQGIEFIDAIISFFNISIRLKGIENVPVDGRYVFVSNHPLGGFDGIVLIKTIHSKFESVKVMVNDILMNIQNLENQFLPINKHGSQSRANAAVIDAAFASDIKILTFPAGLCSRKINGEIADLEWKKNFIAKAIATERMVVPIHFSGQNSKFFYNLSNLRKKLGIKANIEMLFLADELFGQRNASYVITFGKPIHFGTFDKRYPQHEWAARVRQHVYSIKDNDGKAFI